ncbi:hypothetical protein QYF52_09710 [Paenibacillus polymyxa]|uniref:hypothetical protein n=1 Tax=Paenibacillus polymyxa TaxID=1406 RepID=UPI0025B6AD93|nr:hypothetical protein [Paenibacillus polymyxa]MDN4078211.1 hypothetical protein [Paenibacillus polymyxa]MDN4103632.1 hypothetical protein [Paenibacillus polymyxa]MDN4113735.1 hypothetical protein [Paenibacillus polymyxa]
MTKFGRRIFYRKTTGEVLLIRGEAQGDVIESTIDDDFGFYPEIKALDRDQVGVLQLEYGQHTEDFALAIAYRVDPATQSMLFTFPTDKPDDSVPVPQKPLADQVAELKRADLDNKESIAGLIQLVMSQTDAK